MKRIFALLLVFAMVFTLFSGCGNSVTPEKNGDDTDTKTLVLADGDDWEGTDFYQLTGCSSAQYMISERILVRLPNGSFAGGIAESYSISDDGKEITLVIPSDYQFPNGDPLTPEDVKRSLEWGLEISPYNADYAAISEIRVEGQNVILTLDEYSASVLFALSDAFTPVISASQLDKLSADELLWDAVPYGAYYVDEYVEGNYVTLKRNEHFKTHNPNVKNQGALAVETVTVRFFKDTFALVNSVVAGEVDLADLPFDLLSELEKGENIKTTSVPTATVYRLLINTDCELFSDPKVREGLILCLNRDSIADNSEGEMIPGYSFMAPGSIDYSAAAEEYGKSNYGYDSAKGLSLLKEAGWEDTDGDGFLDKNGEMFKFTVLVYNDRTEHIAQMMEIDMKELGIKVEIEIMDPILHTVAVEEEDDYQVALDGFTYADTAGTLPYIVNDEGTFENDEYYDILYDASAEIDDELRVEGFTKAQEMLMDTCAEMPVVYLNMLYAQSEKAEGVIFIDDGFLLNDIK